MKSVIFSLLFVMTISFMIGCSSPRMIMTVRSDGTVIRNDASEYASRYLIMSRAPVMVKQENGKGRAQVGFTNIYKDPIVVTYSFKWLNKKTGEVLRSQDPAMAMNLYPSIETVFEGLCLSDEGNDFEFVLEILRKK